MPTTLRERRKAETTQIIREAALELARSNDVDAISVEAICGRAGISQRTFFNYFPFKEAAFVVPPPAFPDDAVAQFLHGEGPLLDLLVELLAAQARAVSPDRWMVDVSRRVAEGHPKMAALQLASFGDFERSLSNLLARRLGFGATAIECRVIAAAALGALRVVLDEYAQGSRKQLGAAIARDLPKLSILSQVQSLQSEGSGTPKPPTAPRAKRIGK